MRFAGIEGGGTTWVACIAEDNADNIIEKQVFITENPKVTLEKIRVWLSGRKFDAIGIASFGPIDPKVTSQTFGFITSTPKPEWANTDVLKLLGVSDFNKPFMFETDVNAPALAEHFLNNNNNNNKDGPSSCAYITVGTGVGVGLVVNGKTVHGALHPEGGHILVARQPSDTFPGSCPFHGACIEGMCSTVALSSRRGVNPSELPHLSDDDQIWDSLAYQIGQLCATLILTISPERIVIGGGVMNRLSLYPKIRKYVQSILNNYIQLDVILTDKIDNYICPSYWGAEAGLVGACYLAKTAYDKAIAKKEKEKKETVLLTTPFSSTVSWLSFTVIGLTAAIPLLLLLTTRIQRTSMR